jgi:hypothetical protein
MPLTQHSSPNQDGLTPVNLNETLPSSAGSSTLHTNVILTRRTIIHVGGRPLSDIFQDGSTYRESFAVVSVDMMFFNHSGSTRFPVIPSWRNTLTDVAGIHPRSQCLMHYVPR